MRTSCYLGIYCGSAHYTTLYVHAYKGAVEPSRWSLVGLYIVRQIFAYLLVVAIRSCSFRTPARLLPGPPSTQVKNKVVHIKMK